MQSVQRLAACLILAGTYFGVQRLPSPVALFLAKAFALALGASELVAGDLITVQFHGVHGPRDVSFRVKGLGAVRVHDVGTLTAAIIVLAWAIWMAVVVRDLLRWRAPVFVHDNCAEETRAPPRYQRSTEGTKEAARIMALSRNFERMRIAVKVRRERREWRENRRTRRDQPEADEVWDAPSAPCSEGDDDHSGMHSASSPSSPASILRSASSLSSAGRSSPASRSSVRFRHEISELRYFDCLLLSILPGPGRTVQLRLVIRVQNDTAPTLVLELICASSGEQLFCSRVADLIYCDPCLETRQVAFRTATPGSSWLTLEFSPSVPMPCFLSLVVADLRLSMEP